MKRLQYLMSRLGEASTYAGLAAVFGSAASQAPATFQAPLWLATTGCAALAVLLREGDPK